MTHRINVLALMLVFLVVVPLYAFRNPRLIMSSTAGIGIKTRSNKPHVAVIGGGWAGWGAAKVLCEGGARVTLVDAVPDPTGGTPYLTKSGKPFEAGQKGFWYDYPNIVQLLKDLNIKEKDVFTDYLNSSFYSSDGLEATAPVFSSSALPQLPSPLGQVLATFQLFERLPVQDRVTMVGLLYAVVDIYRDEKTFAAYDRLTAHELFIRMGLSKRLVDDFLRPTLLMGLFKAPEELSAAVTMELLYFYALAHQTSFDVRWIKSGTIASCIFSPLNAYLVENYDLTVLGGTSVTGLTLASDSNQVSNPSLITGLTHTRRIPNRNSISGLATEQVDAFSDLDGVVLALGAKGLRSVLSGSPELASLSSQLSTAASMGSIDCIACRLWLDRTVPTRTPANVFSRFEQLRGAGGTFFMLDQLQKDDIDALWGKNRCNDPQANSSALKVDEAIEDESKAKSTESSSAESTEVVAKCKGSVVAVDFYNAGGLMTIGDDNLVATISSELLPACVPEFRAAKVLDACVQRYPGAVTWFSPGSYKLRPRTVVPEVPNLFCAGDWVVMNGNADNLPSPETQTRAHPHRHKGGGIRSKESRSRHNAPFPQTSFAASAASFPKGEHGAKGLCQERAYVSGLRAAHLLLNRLESVGLLDPAQDIGSRSTVILPVRDDEFQVKLGRAFNRKVFKLLNLAGLESPWLR